jgi:hypothetical protein
MLLLGAKCLMRKELPDRFNLCNVNAEKARGLVFLSEKVLYASVPRFIVEKLKSQARRRHHVRP